jgi:diguanylate cyclase (GGDEF)-like protein
MSLYKQLTLLILTLFLLIFAGTYWLNFSSTQAFLNRQMQSQVQDAATSLGLTLVPYLEQEDVSGVQTTVNAIFDRGFYQHISVYDYDDEEIVSREQGVQIDGVPGWFINSVDLEAPSAQQELSSGWALAGRVVVASNPGYAYQQLWGVVKSSFSAYLAVFLLLMVGGFFALQYLLQPLRALVIQARAICNRQFDLEMPVPKVPELATVVTAMNQMVGSVKATFNELSQSVTQLREQAFQDPVTGLGNKRYFQSQLENLIEEQGEARDQEFHPGTLYLIQLNDFKGFNARAGYKKGDALLEAVARKLADCTKNEHIAALSRLNGGDFAFYLLDDNETRADKLAEKLAASLATLEKTEAYDGSQLANIGVATIHKPVPYGTALTRADSALRMSQSKASTPWIRASELDASEIHSMSRNEWNAYITDCVESGKLSLVSQNVVSSVEKNHVLHSELFVRMTDKTGNVIPASRIVPAVKDLKLCQRLDRFVIEQALEHSTKDNCNNTCAVNLSCQTIRDVSFFNWLKTIIEKISLERKVSFPIMYFEFSEQEIIKNLDLVTKYSSEFRSIGCEVGVDQFGKGFFGFSYLNSLRPAYVKVDRSITMKVLSDLDSQFLMTSFTKICRSLDILTIAQGIESREQEEIVINSNVSGMQGRFIQIPRGIR